MSYHYSFALSTRLRADITPVELAALRYVVDAEGEPPAVLPDHAYFSKGLPSYSFRHSYRDFPAGKVLCQSWISRDARGSIDDLGVHLHLPGQKLEGAFGDCFALAQWLATLSSEVGFIGSIVCEDDELGLPTLLFAYAGQLHLADFKDESSIHSTVDDR